MSNDRNLHGTLERLYGVCLKWKPAKHSLERPRTTAIVVAQESSFKLCFRQCRHVSVLLWTPGVWCLISLLEFLYVHLIGPSRITHWEVYYFSRLSFLSERISLWTLWSFQLPWPGCFGLAFARFGVHPRKWDGGKPGKSQPKQPGRVSSSTTKKIFHPCSTPGVNIASRVRIHMPTISLVWLKTTIWIHVARAWYWHPISNNVMLLDFSCGTVNPGHYPPPPSPQC